MKVALVAQRGNPRAVSLVGDVAERLRAADVEVLVDENTSAELEREAVWSGATSPPGPSPEGIAVSEVSAADLVVSVGGDGTFLFAARGAGTTPIMGVNLGEVGFLNAVSPEAAVETVLAEVGRIREEGAPRTTKLHRLAASGPDWTLPPALNEVVVQGARRGPGHGLSVEVRVDGALFSSGHADGVLLATATGSTAYNLSEDGPLVHPAVGGFVLTQMCGVEGTPSLVLEPDQTVTVRVDDTPEAVVVSDGRIREEVDPPANVTIERAAEPVYIAGPPLDFFTALGKLD